MKVAFWIAAVIILIANYSLFLAFYNVYFKNYNGGPSSSSGSIYMPLLAGVIIFITGMICYFTGNFSWALGIMGLPVIFVLLYLFFWVVLPILLGGRMN